MENVRQKKTPAIAQPIVIIKNLSEASKSLCVVCGGEAAAHNTKNNFRKDVRVLLRKDRNGSEDQGNMEEYRAWMAQGNLPGDGSMAAGMQKHSM
jgi:hypothetical protein